MSIQDINASQDSIALKGQSVLQLMEISIYRLCKCNSTDDNQTFKDDNLIDSVSNGMNMTVVQLYIC